LPIFIAAAAACTSSVFVSMQQQNFYMFFFSDAQMRILRIKLCLNNRHRLLPKGSDVNKASSIKAKAIDININEAFDAKVK
jgi:hypothetical protein